MSTREIVEPINSVEWMGTIACTGSTVLVTASTMSAPPAENAALKTAARKVPATMMKNVVSICAARTKSFRLAS